MDAVFWNIQLANYYAFLEKGAVVLAILILLSSLDDLFIDLWFWIRLVWRRLTVFKRASYRPLTAKDLRARDEQPLAIMVPAWAEYDVIAQMVENMIDVLDYREYVVFVGTYPNDHQTIAEVERMRRRYRRLQRVEVPHAGPTNKADCLNWLILSIFDYEKRNGIEFAGLVLHDSEDVLHPLELRFFNYLLPRKDMIQLPVTSLDREWYELVAGTYMDEFAEWHAKDLVVRESLAGTVPSAGVGTCFSRRALLELSAQTNNQPFNTDSLTEDYDIGERLSRLGMHSIFARFPVEFRVRRPSAWFGWGGERERNLKMALCVREYFPDNFRAAYRQKARWVLGIGLQSWETLGWGNSLINRYLLLRDRKGIVTSFVSILAYLLFIQLMVFWVLKMTGVWTMEFPTVFQAGSWPMSIALFTTGALVARVLQRMYFVNRLYGWEHAVMSAPRMVVGNVINCAATARAWRMFAGYLLFGKRLVWDKTMHDFPSNSQLVQTRRRLGELLSVWQAVEPEQLQQALEQQQDGRQQPLGRILVSQGWLDDETLAEAISFQEELPRANIDVAYLQQGEFPLPVDSCVHWRVLPLPSPEPDVMRLAVASALPEAVLLGLAEEAKVERVEQLVARESEINAGLRLICGSDYKINAVPLLGDLLVEMKLISREHFQVALDQYRPHRDGRIGAYLVRRGVASEQAIATATEEQQRRTREARLHPDVFLA